MPYSKPDQPPASTNIRKSFPSPASALISLTLFKAESVNFIMPTTLSSAKTKSIRSFCSEIYAKKVKIVIFLNSFLEAFPFSK